MIGIANWLGRGAWADHKSWRASGVPKGLRECLVVAAGGWGMRIKEHRALKAPTRMSG